MNAKELSQLFAIIATEYPRNFDISTERTKLWGMILKHATYGEAVRAVTDLLGEARPFPPVVGEINQAILANRKADRKEQFKLEMEKRQKALPPPVIHNEEDRKKALQILKQFSIDMANKKSVQ